MRIFWLEILLVFAPFFLYRIYVAFVVKRKVETGGTYNEVPLAALFIAGLVLALISFFIMGIVGERVTGGDYTPATFEDGEVIPPHIDE